MTEAFFRDHNCLRLLSVAMASVLSQPKTPVVDEVTPYKIGILILIDEYCKILKRKLDGDLPLDEIMSEEQERELLISLLHLVQGADIDLSQLIRKIKDFVKPSLINALMKRMKLMMEDSVHALMDLFKDLPASLFSESGTLHRSSVLGLFLRRMVIAFNKLMFNQISRLHREFCQFYESWAKGSGCPATEVSALDLTTEASSLMDVLDEESYCPPPDHCDDATQMLSTKYSHRQGELFIAQQTFLLQHSPTTAMSPKELQDKLNGLLMNNPAISEAHYLSYLNNLRLNEYCGAQLNLHLFFDRQLVATTTKSKTDEQAIPRGYRYAALNMAALHYTFGHRAESLAALQEAIQLAQEANDHVCLQHALGWLQRLSEQGTGTSAYMLDRLVNKAGELNLAYLTSLGVQSFAKHNALASAQPATVFEFLLKSDIVNCQHSLCDLKCISYAQKASLWSLYGRREMYSLSSQGMLMLNTADLGVYHSGDAECTALCHMAQLHLEQGEMHHAALILKAAKERFPASSPQACKWKLCEQQQRFTLALYHGDYEDAECAITNMTALSPLQACFSRCLLLKERGMVRAALDLSTSLRSQCEGESQEMAPPQLYARLLLLQGELHCVCGNSYSAPQPLLSCLTLCRQRHYSYLVALTTIHLALVQFYQDMPKQALLLIEEVFITILSHGSLYDQARATYLWIRCSLAAAAKESAEAKRKALFVAVEKNEKVLSCFRKVQAHRRTKDAVYFQARWYHELGFTAERNKCAHEFKELDLQYPTWKPMDVCCL